MRRKLVSIKYWPSLPRWPWVVAYRQGGKRVTRYFRAEREAKALARLKFVELTNEGRKHSAITDAERRAVIAAREANVPLVEIIDDYLKERQARARSVALMTAIEEFVDIRESEGKSRGHVKDLTLKLKAFARRHDGNLVAEVATRDVDSHLASLAVTPQTRLNHRRALHNFFAFAAARGYAASNPVAPSARPKVVSGPPAILTPAQTRALLAACPGEIVAAVAIAAFAGLRHAEVTRLAWDKVSIERGFIEVAAAHSKTGARRLVPITPNLRSWLERSSGSGSGSSSGSGSGSGSGSACSSGSGSGRVCPKDYRRLFREAHKTAGIKPWPRNALRHSFASYHLALHRNAAATALELGHIETRTLFAHYRELVTAEAAEEYFLIKKSLEKA
jgi:integrase